MNAATPLIRPHPSIEALEGDEIFAEAQRRVIARRGLRPAIVKPRGSRCSVGAITLGWSASNSDVDHFHRALGSMSAARAWDRAVVAECRAIERELSQPFGMRRTS